MINSFLSKLIHICYFMKIYLFNCACNILSVSNREFHKKCSISITTQQMLSKGPSKLLLYEFPNLFQIIDEKWNKAPIS